MSSTAQGPRDPLSRESSSPAPAAPQNPNEVVAYLRAVMAAQMEMEPEAEPEPERPKGLARFLKRKPQQEASAKTRMITADEPAAKPEATKRAPKGAGPVVVRTASPEAPAEAAEPGSRAVPGQASAGGAEAPREAAPEEIPQGEARRTEPDAARGSVSGAEAVRQAMEMTGDPAATCAEAEAAEATEAQEALTWEVFTARSHAWPEARPQAAVEAGPPKPPAAMETARAETLPGGAQEAAGGAAAKRGEVLPPAGASAERGRAEAGRPGTGRVITMQSGGRAASGETPAS